MAAFITELWESIFTPGPTPTILKATNATFAALQITLVSLLLGTHSVHFVVLSILCAGLWWSINWFAAELKKAQMEEARKEELVESAEKRASMEGDGDEGDDTETEREGVGKVSSSSGYDDSAKISRQVKRRPGGTRKSLNDTTAEAATADGGGTSTSVSTEDEWEKVSEGDKEK